MKNKLHIITILAALATTPPLVAAEKKGAKESSKETALASPSPTTEAKAKALPFKGKIASVDKDKKTFSVESKKGEGRTFTVPASAKLLKNETETATWDDLKVGEVVRGTYLKSADGTMEVGSLKLGAKPEGDKAEKKAAKKSAGEAAATP
ncbi:MAG: hypothetical protein QOD99_1829 [Chthoniobacter sp.]|jgi:hypothetical protein|nr:hypothetical protein [Chthoniobacter sp.]